MIEKILKHFGYIKKPIELKEIDNDDELLNKARTLIGQKVTIMGICGDVEQARLTGVVGITKEMGYKEVRFNTSDDFYSTVLYKPETVMNWKYN